MPVGELRQVVLHLERVVPKLVVRRERLGAERGVDRAVLQDVDHREESAGRGAAFVLRRVTGDEAVGQRIGEDGVQFPDTRLDVLENLIVRVLEVQPEQARAAAAEAERRRVRDQQVGARVELVVPEAELVPLADVVVALDQEALRGRKVLVVRVRPGLVPEPLLQDRAELVEVRRQDARDVARGRFTASVGAEGRAGLRRGSRPRSCRTRRADSSRSGPRPIRRCSGN